MLVYVTASDLKTKVGGRSHTLKPYRMGTIRKVLRINWIFKALSMVFFVTLQCRAKKETRNDTMMPKAVMQQGYSS